MITKFIRIYCLGNTNVCTKCHGKPSDSYWDILIWWKATTLRSSSVGRYSGGSVSSLSPILISRSSTTSFSCNNYIQVRIAEVRGRLLFHEQKQKILSPISGYTLTMFLGSSGTGWGAGVISPKMSDRASRAVSAPGVSWGHEHRQKESDVTAGFFRESKKAQRVLVHLPLG